MSECEDEDVQLQVSEHLVSSSFSSHRYLTHVWAVTGMSMFQSELTLAVLYLFTFSFEIPLKEWQFEHQLWSCVNRRLSSCAFDSGSSAASPASAAAEETENNPLCWLLMPDCTNRKSITTSRDVIESVLSGSRDSTGCFGISVSHLCICDCFARKKSKISILWKHKRNN